MTFGVCPSTSWGIDQLSSSEIVDSLIMAHPDGVAPGFSPLRLLLNSAPGAPSPGVNRAEQEELKKADQAIQRFAESMAPSALAEQHAVVGVARDKAVDLISVLSNLVMIYPSSMAQKSQSFDFATLVPRPAMALLASRSIEVKDAIDLPNSDQETVLTALSRYIDELDRFDQDCVEPILTELETVKNDSNYRVKYGGPIETRLHDRLWTRYQSYQGKMAELVESMNSELAKFEAVRTAAEEAATETGKRRLKRDFGSVGNRETGWATLWTVFAFLLTVAAISIPVILFSSDVNFASVTGTPATLIKTFIGVPLLAFAAYCGKVASQHRDTARHMKSLVSQIESVGAYVATLPDASKDEIRLALGKRAFANPELEAEKIELATGTGELTLALSKALDIISKFGDKAK